MDFFFELIRNHILIAAGCAWLTAQILKFFIHAIVEHRFDFERLRGDGGMPSAHSSTVTTLAIMTGYVTGFDSALFAIAVILAVIVMHDATGVRRETGKQSVNIQQLFAAINDMLSDKDKISQTEKLKLLVGHSPLQVFFGAITGVIVSLVYILLFLL